MGRKKKEEDLYEGVSSRCRKCTKSCKQPEYIKVQSCRDFEPKAEESRW